MAGELFTTFLTIKHKYFYFNSENNLEKKHENTPENTVPGAHSLTWP